MIIYNDLVCVSGRYHGRITGKIKDDDLYIVQVYSRDNDVFVVSNYNLFKPNRNLEVEWGRFNGSTREMIAEGKQIEKE